MVCISSDGGLTFSNTVQEVFGFCFFYRNNINIFVIGRSVMSWSFLSCLNGRFQSKYLALLYRIIPRFNFSESRDYTIWDIQI